MKHFLSIIFAAIFCASASAQTIRTLGYNTNGQVVAATNVTWTNSFNFSTNTVAAQVRTNLSLGASNSPSFTSVYLSGDITANSATIQAGGIVFEDGGEALTRTNLGLRLPALTNTSNVTMMRALAGSTNTNQPFSGSISVVGTNNTNTLIFSNGILLSQ